MKRLLLFSFTTILLILNGSCQKRIAVSQFDSTKVITSVKLVTQEELQTELCNVPTKNSEREEAMINLLVQAGADKTDIKFQVVDGARNIYVVKEGRTDKFIVVGGHIDKVNPGKGVIDDWSGASAVSNIYQAIKDLPTEHTIVFIGFAKEESGLLGSRAYVQSLGEEARARCKAMVNLECLGPAEAHIWVNGSDESLIDILRTTATKSQLPLKEHRLYGVSADSNSFRAKKIPAITIDGLPEEKFGLIHSENDSCGNVNPTFYYDSYRLAVDYLLELDKTLK
ncbi:MAG: M28 family peptidase [Blastocatellia bacterium]|nr:M28 family peptidase [Blastocatellia bacterium]